MDHLQDKKNRQDSLVLTARHVPRSLLAKESKLMGRKWPAYRFTSPWDATALYAQDYRDHFQVTFGMSAAFEIAPDKPSFLVLWEMRQAADSWRMPYGDFLRIAFSLNQRNHVRFVEPHDKWALLADNRNFRKKAKKFKHDLWSLYLQQDMGPQFHVEAFAGLPSQVYFRESLIEAAEQSGDWSALIRNQVIKHTCLPMAVLKGRVDSELIPRIRDAMRTELEHGILASKPFLGLAPHQLWQSCYGVPGACIPAESPCSVCPVRQNCLAAAEIVERAAAVPDRAIH